jgi:hypothetical protein
VERIGYYQRAFGLLLWLTTVSYSEETSWSLAPINRPAVPKIESSSPIDAFVQQRLHDKGLSLSPPADRSTWLRRVTFDLTGLPPSLPEIVGFLVDSAPGARERVVDRLLASPRYGERWARHWMDVVRYAETQGHDEDAIREHAWPYRDYLIRSLNADKPYAAFIREQIAGDVLGDVAATGFLASGPWDGSSQMGIQDGTIDKKVAQYLDRDDMLSATLSTFTSTTVHCARCHDHKFDPISLEDYYALQAVFAGIDKVDRPFEANPELADKRNKLLAEQAQLNQGGVPDARLDAVVITEWEDTWIVLAPKKVHSEAGTPFTIQSDGSILFGGTTPLEDTVTLSGQSTGQRVTAVQVEVLPHPSFPAQGPGRAENGNLHLSEVEIRIDGKTIPIKSASADFNQQGWEIDQAIDGKPETAWGIHPQEGKVHRAAFLLADAVATTPGMPIDVVLKQVHGREHVIGRPRVSLSSAANPTIGEVRPAELAIPAAERTPEQHRVLARAWLKQELARQLAALPESGMVFAVASQFEAKGNFKPAVKPRDVHVLARGDIHSPGELATPGALSCIPTLPARFDLANPEDEGARRVALANWIAHPDNVLTWRSIVNRIWHYHFGRGIVDTPNDLGKMGGTPSHPELLDWLAVEFREGGGNLKQLHKRIVLSETYGQSSADRDACLAIDAENRLLWRMNQRRLDAESMRDAVLSLSGKLDLTMYGPSARQFNSSKGIHVTPVVDYRNFDPDDPANFRRSVYRFVFRTVPDPLMQALDCPDASLLVPRRDTSTTALQALAMLNNRFMVRQSEHLAARLEQSNRDLPAQIAELLLRAYGRPAAEHEVAELRAYAHTHGLANAGRIVINSSEFLFVP